MFHVKHLKKKNPLINWGSFVFLLALYHEN